MPKRATKGSAGYDFFAPFDIVLNPGETIKVPTGIRVSMEENYVLKVGDISSVSKNGGIDNSFYYIGCLFLLLIFYLYML